MTEQEFTPGEPVIWTRVLYPGVKHGRVEVPARFVAMGYQHAKIRVNETGSLRVVKVKNLRRVE